MSTSSNTIIEHQNYSEVVTWTVEELMDAVSLTPKKKNKISIPKYQRNLVWSDGQKKSFIDSLKIGFPFGALLLFKVRPDGENVLHTLVDGLQRTTTIMQYVEQPTKFFDRGNLEEELIKQILEVTDQSNDKSEEVIKVIVEWVQGLKGFKESAGYSSYALAKEIVTKLYCTADKTDALTNALVPFKEKLESEANITNIKIPIIIYSGAQKNLPTIFERLNSKGTQLSKYQIYAATWSTYDPINISNRDVIKKIKAKYDALIEEGLQVENYDPSSNDFYTGTFNIFEYTFGLGKYFAEKHPELFGENDKVAATESIGFNICTVCLNLNINQMPSLPDKLLRVDREKFEKSVLSAIYDVSSQLKPFISLRANKKKNDVNSKHVIYHSEFQIVSLIGKVFLSKYDQNLDEQPSWKGDKDRVLNNIAYHYLYDILREFWRGSGDAKVNELVQENSRYEHPLYKENWENILDEWFAAQLQRREKQRTAIKDSDVLFLKYMYTHLLTSYEENSTTEFEIEHLVPVAPLKSVGEQDGLPISAVSNLRLIGKEVNRDKSDLTIYQYFEKQVAGGEMTFEQAQLEIESLEKFTFTTEEELRFVSELNAENFTAFLRQQFTKLKEKFYELNDVKKQG